MLSSLVIFPTWLSTKSFTRLCSYWTLCLVVATTNMEVATWFLMLVLDTTTAEWGSSNAWIVILSRYLKWLLMFWLLLLFEGWKWKWFGNTSISLFPGESSWLKEGKEEKTSLNLLSMSTIRFLILDYCLSIRLSSDSQ